MCELRHTSLVVQKTPCGDEKAPAVDGPGRGSTAIKSDPCFSAERARRLDTPRGAPGRPSGWAIRTASISHHRAPSAFRTLRTMRAERVGLALPAAGRFQ